MLTINTIHHGDCFELMKEIPDKSIDLILADPPYAVLNKGNKHAQWDKEIDLQKLWKHYNRIIKDNGAIILFGQGAFSASVIMSNRYMFKYNLVWDKMRKTGFLNANRMPLRQHEDILVFYKNLPTYNPQMKKITNKNERSHRGGNGCSNKVYGKYKTMPNVIADDKYPTSIISFQKQWNKEAWMHPTSKPVPLLQYLIKTYSNDGELVLDNFAGSASTCIAAIREKRNFIGIELNDEFFQIAKQRVEHEINQLILKIHHYEGNTTFQRPLPELQGIWNSQGAACHCRHPLQPFQFSIRVQPQVVCRWRHCQRREPPCRKAIL